MIQYLPTIFVCIVLGAIVALAIFSIVRDRKKGKSSCGGSCAGCAMNCHCHSAEKKEES
ncbi:MAG: FeoB-associated Cys-rich membrane protein [Clostridia bacterium]|nr:FeoB-associated Cys-rich membrane protein [Clostridia bacterium]